MTDLDLMKYCLQVPATSTAQQEYLAGWGNINIKGRGNDIIFTESAHWADSVSKSRCPSVVCVCAIAETPLLGGLETRPGKKKKNYMAKV